jgi:two-component system chemotaxis response regulator CheB
VALGELLGQLDRAPCPVVVAQHMPGSFTGGFALSLARQLGRPVTEGVDGTVLEAGTVTILKGGADHAVRRLADGRLILRAVADSGEPHHPSANILFASAAEAARTPVAVILTGMGEDGTGGAKHLRERELPVLVQDPASCAVSGMPGAAIRAGLATDVLPVGAIARRLNSWFNR